MAAGKKGILQTLKDDVIELYGKEQVIPILLRGGCIALIYVLFEVSKLEPKPLPEPPKQKVE